MTKLNKLASDQSFVLDLIKKRLCLRTDSDLAERLEVHKPVISNFRSGRQKIGAVGLISIHEESGISIKELKSLLNWEEDSAFEHDQTGLENANALREVKEIDLIAQTDSRQLKYEKTQVQKTLEEVVSAVGKQRLSKGKSIKNLNQSVSVDLLSRAFKMLRADTIIVQRELDLRDPQAVKNLENFKKILLMSYALGRDSVAPSPSPVSVV